MKRFFEEYGTIIVTSVVAVTLIAITVALRNPSAQALGDVVNGWTKGVEESLNIDTLSNSKVDKVIPVTETIYWGIDDTNKLIISDASVTTATGGRSGGFAGTETFSYNTTPWYSYRNAITSVKVAKVNEKVAPVSTAYWFYQMLNATDIDMSDLNVCNVTDMSSMFEYAGYNATTWSIGDLSNWNTSKVTDMGSMFNNAGKNATTWSIGDLSNWNTSKVTDMGSMFNTAGKNATNFNLDLSGWNTSNVTNMGSMFSVAGYNATTFNLDLSGWDTSNVTNMKDVFDGVGYNATTLTITGLDNWNTSNVTNMRCMFNTAGKNATTWSIGDLSNWNTSNVTDMENMFSCVGYYGRYSLNLSSWNVDKVTSHSGFNFGVTTKVTPPTWVK